MLRKLCVLSSLFLAFTLVTAAQDSRHFTFHYGFTVKNLPADKKVRIWIPAALAASPIATIHNAILFLMKISLYVVWPCSTPAHFLD